MLIEANVKINRQIWGKKNDIVWNQNDYDQAWCISLYTFKKPYHERMKGQCERHDETNSNVRLKVMDIYDFFGQRYTEVTFTCFLSTDGFNH